MDAQTKIRQLREACDFCSATPNEFAGMTYREILLNIEFMYPAAVIYWGCWTDEDLDTVLVVEL